MPSRVFPKHLFFTAATYCLLAVPVAMAQQATGQPGSASATTTISGKSYPHPNPNSAVI